VESALSRMASSDGSPVNPNTLIVRLAAIPAAIGPLPAHCDARWLHGAAFQAGQAPPRRHP
jgi:hypothetical protein